MCRRAWLGSGFRLMCFFCFTCGPLSFFLFCTLPQRRLASGWIFGPWCRRLACLTILVHLAQALGVLLFTKCLLGLVKGSHGRGFAAVSRLERGIE